MFVCLVWFFVFFLVTNPVCKAASVMTLDPPLAYCYVTEHCNVEGGYLSLVLNPFPITLVTHTQIKRGRGLSCTHSGLGFVISCCGDVELRRKTENIEFSLEK